VNACGDVRPTTSLERLAAARPRRPEETIDWSEPIDRSRWFFCETLTPLFYAPIYRDLDERHRRRYNQLTAMMANEIIGFMEREFLVPALVALAAVSDETQPAGLRDAVSRFADDERRHADIWWNLNRLSEPDWYHSANSRLLRVPAGALAAARFIARHPIALPVVFWLQLVQEERSLEISRRCMRIPARTIEPRYASAYAAHLTDEARHVQIDRHLIEHYYRHRSAVVRRITARLFTTIVRSLLVTPVHSTSRVVRILVREFPELASLEPTILFELGTLGSSLEYHQMMYSRAATPVTFALFDACPEFHGISNVLLAYAPRTQGGC
jgi:hypothetical protein